MWLAEQYGHMIEKPYACSQWGLHYRIIIIYTWDMLLNIFKPNLWKTHPLIQGESEVMPDFEIIIKHINIMTMDSKKYRE